MIYLHLIVEGETERRFGTDVLEPYMGVRSDYQYCIDVSLITTSRDRSRGRVYKGGLGSYEKVKKEIGNRIKQYSGGEHFFTTMLDLYALPNDFPGYSDAQRINDPYQKVERLEISLAEDIGDHRFIPYIQLHEFEAMIFVDPSKLSLEYPNSENKIELLKNVLNENSVRNNPELINESEATAPSKRIIQYFPFYDSSKPIVGVNTVARIGIDAIRSQCPHFNEWLKKLENLQTN